MPMVTQQPKLVCYVYVHDVELFQCQILISIVTILKLQMKTVAQGLQVLLL